MHPRSLQAALGCLLLCLVACEDLDDGFSERAGGSVDGGSLADNTGTVAGAHAIDCAGLDWSEQARDFEDEVFELVNAQRAQGATCGDERMPSVSALVMNGILMCTARAHSHDMATQNYFSHNSLDGTTPFERMSAAGYQYRAAAENIAQGQRTPEQVMQSWMSSPGHCLNIMGGQYEDFGVGYELNGHLWTQNFGRAR